MPSKYYKEGKPPGQIYHARLRTQCSSFNHHLYLKNIVASPSCECGGVETMRHYLLECTRFNHLRHRMLNNLSHLSPTSLNTLLFGNQELTEAINKQIIDIFHDYILKSKRFQVQ